jgi:hypothetical protein
VQPRSTRWSAVAALVPVLLAACIYFPITRSFFYADDFVCLLSIRNDGFLRFVLRPFAGHDLVVRNLVFYASAWLFGLRAELFFWTVLLTHLLNVWLLYRVLRNLTASVPLACVGAALWGTSPVLLGTLGWYSVYGQVLVASALLVVLDRVTHLARTGNAPGARAAGGWYVLLLLGSACFGTGVGVAVAFPATLFLLLPAAWRSRGIRMAFLTLPLTTIALYFGDRSVDAMLEPVSIEELIGRDISLARLLGGRHMLPDLVAAGIDTALRSFFVSFSQPPGWARALTLGLFGAGLLLLLWRGDTTTRRAVLGMTILCLAVYTPIAVGRSGFVDPRALAIQTRYHYVGTLPIVVLACLVLGHLGRNWLLQPVPVVAFLVVAITLGVYGWARSDFRIDDHAAAQAYFSRMLQGMDVEVASHPSGSIAFLENGKVSSVLLGPIMAKVARDFPGRAAAFVLAHGTDELDGRRLRFIERDPAVIRWYATFPKTLLARLLVAPDAVPRP